MFPRKISTALQGYTRQKEDMEHLVLGAGQAGSTDTPLAARGHDDTEKNNCLRGGFTLFVSATPYSRRGRDNDLQPLSTSCRLPEAAPAAWYFTGMRSSAFVIRRVEEYYLDSGFLLSQ